MDPELSMAPWTVSAADYPADGSIERRARFLLRYAILAPSSHNSQPWTFSVDGATVAVRADESRWLRVADPDRRELHLSLGCAVENLLVAAGRFDLGHTVEYHDAGDRVATVTLDPDGTPGTERPAGLFDAIADRYTSHEAFEPRALPDDLLAGMRDSVVEDGVAPTLVDDAATRRRVADLQATADERLFDDPDYRRELGRWIGSGALGDGWVGARVGKLAVTYVDLGPREARKNAEHVRGSPVVAVLSAPDERSAQVRAGQAFERLALLAAREGAAVHPLSQILEVPALRAELADELELAHPPQHLFRVGFPTATEDHTPRRPLAAVLRSEQ